TAVDDAQALPEGTDAEKATKTEALNDAVAGLVTVVDEDLATAKRAADAKEAEADYATKYTTATRTALTNAQALPEGTDAEKATKTEALNDAVAGLVTVVDEDLATAKRAADAKEAEADYATKYTAATRTALTNAQELPEGTDAEKAAKTEALNDAVEGLEE
ncbi:hypothetical protein ACIQZM_09080, partial [Peribacillus sp. NPDC097206]|uniref:hypothetical protein n=1 Tax=Peribacillus sp. NPDC097206 TaxID=3364398 RepID=UPI003828D294